MAVRAMCVVALIALGGCAGGVGESQDVAPAGYETSLDTWHTERFAEGRAVYRESCAACHDPGASNAPAIGAKKDWNDRSRLWTAVLFEHAKEGYLAMPSKGGAGGLTDTQVTAAAEYILTVTYPELPVD